MTLDRSSDLQHGNELITARRLAAIVESSDDAIISKDLDGTIASWNKAAEQMFGYTADEAVGRSIRVIVPDDFQDAETAVLERIRRGERIDHYETVRQRKDGSRVPISLSISPLRNEYGVVVGASTISRDISDRKRAEEATRREHRRTAFLERMTAALSKSLDYRESLQEIVALAVPDLADWCAVDVVNEEDGSLVRLEAAHVDPEKLQLAQAIRQRTPRPLGSHSAAEVVRTGAPALIPVVRDEMLVTASHGDEEQLAGLRALGLASYLCVPFVSGGAVLGALTLATTTSARHYGEDDLRFAEDIASRAALALENARSYARLERANRLKDEFLATLSHELRTPLNAIVGYSRILNSGMLSGGRTAHALDTIERNATALTQMVEDLLDISRIVAGKMRLNVQPVDLPAVVREAIETIRPAADAKRIRLQMLIDPHVGPIFGDPDRLRQIVWNLLSNAVKFTPKEGRVQVRLHRVDSSLEIGVTDSGVGIPAEFLPHLFERFRQADATLARRHGGLGLGLAIVRNLVEMHGGQVSASSDGPGTGATFRVRLPIMVVHAEPGDEPRVEARPSIAPPREALPDLHGTHVLVVDDEPDALGLLREILQTAGARVTTASSAAAALDAIGPAAPDVLVADLGMPQMDGFELIRRVRDSSNEKVREVPAAALTAYARSEDRTRALQSGFEMHLAKPVDPLEFASAVKALARLRRRS